MFTDSSLHKAPTNSQLPYSLLQILLFQLIIEVSRGAGGTAGVGEVKVVVSRSLRTFILNEVSAMI